MGAGTLGKFWLLVLALVVLGACSTTFTDETGTISVSLTSGWEEASDEDRLALQERWGSEIIYAAAYLVDGEELAMFSWIHETAFFVIGKTSIGWSKPITPDEARNAVAERRLLLARSGDTRDLGSGELNGYPYAKYLWRGDTTDYVAIVMLISTGQHIYRVICTAEKDLWDEGRCNKAVDAVEFTGPQPPTLTPSTATAAADAADTRPISSPAATILALIYQRQTATAEASQIPPTPTPSPTPLISIVRPPAPRPTSIIQTGIPRHPVSPVAPTATPARPRLTLLEYWSEVRWFFREHTRAIQEPLALLDHLGDALSDKVLGSALRNEAGELVSGFLIERFEWDSIAYPPIAERYHLKMAEYLRVNWQWASAIFDIVEEALLTGEYPEEKADEADRLLRLGNALYDEANAIGTNDGVIPRPRS